MPVLLPLALLAQLSTSPPMGSVAPVTIAPLPIPRRSSVVKSAPEPETRIAAPEDDRLSRCLSRTRADPTAGVAEAHAWLAEGGGAMAQVRANQCLGMALTDLGNFTDAAKAFGAAVDGVPPEQDVAAVPLMAMAGNAALGGGDAQTALGWFDKAVAVPGYPDKVLIGGVQADRARALVALNRAPDAANALAEARTLAPGNPDVWLLSATLARRDNNLAAAQTYIERAAALEPRDAAIGLEAGVIAVLSGRDDAARRSWQSVLALAPGSNEAQIAQRYLDQLGSAKAPATAPATPEPANKDKPSP